MKRVEQAVEIFKLNVAVKASEQVLATLPQDTGDEGRKNGIRAGTLERLRRLKGTQ